MRKITRIKCLIVVLLTFIGTLAPVHAQQSGNFEISGVVKDTSGEPVIGATVIVKNTQIGTTTDVDGKFKLKVPHKSLLQILPRSNPQFCLLLQTAAPVHMDSGKTYPEDH